jgi:hypothetical protein
LAAGRPAVNRAARRIVLERVRITPYDTSRQA